MLAFGTTFKRLMIFSLSVLILVNLFHSVRAENTTESNAANIDLLWMLICAVLVFMMQAGFMCLESGIIRNKNNINVALKNVSDFGISIVCYWMIGYGFMFGASKSGFIGLDDFLFDPTGALESGPAMTFFIFQSMFCATAASIISGAVAERTKFTAYLIYAIAVTGFIYPIFGSWVWGGGWLNDVGPGFVDFAGSTVVHSVGGWAALAGAIVVGPRLGKYIDGKPQRLPGHSVVLMALGVFILWFGWFGFNAGSTVSGNDGSIAVIFITTNLAAAAGAVGAMVLSYAIWKRFDVYMTLNGVIAGLVAITAGCANMGPGMALLTGLIGGFVVVGSAVLLESVLKIDDPVGAIAAHGFTGAWGTLAVGLFAQEEFGGINGLLFGGGAGQLGAQFVGVLAAFIFVFGTSFIVFKLIDLTIGMRASDEEQEIGLDVTEHSASGYPDFTNVAQK